MKTFEEWWKEQSISPFVNDGTIKILCRELYDYMNREVNNYNGYESGYEQGIKDSKVLNHKQPEKLKEFDVANPRTHIKVVNKINEIIDYLPYLTLLNDKD